MGNKLHDKQPEHSRTGFFCRHLHIRIRSVCVLQYKTAEMVSQFLQNPSHQIERQHIVLARSLARSLEQVCQS